MDTDTPRTDEILEDAPLRLCGESATEAFEIMLRHARELEREVNEMTAKQIELVNHLNKKHAETMLLVAENYLKQK